MNSHHHQYRLDSNSALMYCMTDTVELGFSHPTNGTSYGPRSGKCQKLTALACATDWNSTCDFMAANTAWAVNQVYPYPNECARIIPKLTLGEQLVRNAAAYKYADKALSVNCVLETEEFNPLDKFSPQITNWVDKLSGKPCPRTFTLQITSTQELDTDPVMNALLEKPVIGFDILMSIRASLEREGRLSQINGTKLAQFFRFVDARRAQFGR